MQTIHNKTLRSFLTVINPYEQHLLNGLTDPSTKTYRFLCYFAFSSLFLGFKFGQIHFFGNPTPFWDQWDAEAATLYRYWFDGTLNFKHLVENHNEHRILTTRLLALILIILNKLWNPLLQMVVNAGLHLMAVLLLNALITKVVGRAALPVILAFSLVLFSIPFGWENTLAGFQGQFYFVFLFSIATIWLLVTSEPLDKKWWLGVVMGILAYLSLASGLFVFLTGAFMGLLLYLLRLHKGYKPLIAVAILAVIFISGVKLTPSLPHQEVLKSHSFSELYYSLRLVLGWPVADNVLSVIIRNLPIGIFVFIVLRKYRLATNMQWFLFALCVWSIGQALSIAYGRAAGPMSSRYKDLHIIPVFINFACLIAIAQANFDQWRRYAIMGFAFWTAIVLASVGRKGFKDLPDELAMKRKWNQAEERNTKNYIATGNINYLINKPEMDVPYPRPERLAEIIELPGVREFLPTNIKEPLRPDSITTQPNSAFVINGYNKTFPENRPDTAWGSYNKQRDSAMGSTLLHFNAHHKNVTIEIPVTGYPLDNGIKLEFIQNGQVKQLRAPDNPGEYWYACHTRLNDGDFSIRITDSSATSWVAIGKPLEIGRLERLTNWLLEHYYFLISIGATIVLVLLATKTVNALKQFP
jgi:hypothetical protein